MKFQSLTGRLKTVACEACEVRIECALFQSLTGRLKTLENGLFVNLVRVFQSLTGRLKTAS